MEDNDEVGPSRVMHTDSSGTFSGFISEQESSEEGKIHEAGPSGRVLLQSAVAHGWVEDASDDDDGPIANMEHQPFARGKQEITTKTLLRMRLLRDPTTEPPSEVQ